MNDLVYNMGYLSRQEASFAVENVPCCQATRVPYSILRLRWAPRPKNINATTRHRPRAAAFSSGSGGSGDGSSGSSGGGGGGGHDGSPSGDEPQRLPPLVWLVLWAAVTEAVAVWQYKKLAVERDSRRRAELFPDSNKKQPEPPASQQPTAPPKVSIIVPVLNEEAGLPKTLHYLQQQLEPAPAEIIVVDGGSSDGTVQVAQRCGVRVVRAARGRARQMNAGAAVATGDILAFVHADTRAPQGLVRIVRDTLRRQQVVLGGFRPIIEHADGSPMLFFSANNSLKTYYGPLILRPISFLRGLRCLFGDQTLFCRAADFRRVGGYDSRLPLMEDADLCIRLHMAGPAARPGRRGQVLQINSCPNITSGRRLASWGNFYATVVHVILAGGWYFGATPQQLRWLYQKLYTDMYR